MIKETLKINGFSLKLKKNKYDIPIINILLSSNKITFRLCDSDNTLKKIPIKKENFLVFDFQFNESCWHSISCKGELIMLENNSYQFVYAKLNH